MVQINWYGVVGVILSNLLGIRIAQSYIKNRLVQAHDYNEYLFYLSFASCVIWIYYSILTQDVYVFTSCIVSIITTFAFIQAIFQGLQSKPYKLLHVEIATIIFFSYWLTMILIHGILGLISDELATKIIGLGCLVVSITKNFSPCLVLYQVIKTQDTTLIYFPQALIGFANLVLWFAYSITISDLYQVLSNGASALVCLVQLIIYWYIKLTKE
jgi:uncharacterized protein with PQ loop repeat